MMMTVSRLMLTAAATSLAFAPVAVQAGTRAGDNGSVYSANAGLGRNADGESVASGAAFILALFASAAIISGIVFATDEDDTGQSPGT